jgi:hypothetical protein
MVLVKYCLFLLIVCKIVSFQVLGRYIQMVRIVMDFITNYHVRSVYMHSKFLSVYMHSKFLTFFLPIVVAQD